MYKNSWRKNFQFNSFRGGQEEALVSMADALDKGIRFVIAELPTGVGKSDIAMALARTSDSSFIVTSQNILINQYKNDFSKKLNEFEFYSVKGKRHYSCKGVGTDCEDGDKMGCASWKRHCEDVKSCTYKTARDKAASAKVALVNTTYFAVATTLDPWGARDIAIIDEAHNLANEVMNLVELKIDDYKLDRLKIAHRIPKFGIEDKSFKDSVSNKQFTSWLAMLKEELDRLVKMIDDEDPSVEYWDRDDIKGIQDLHRRIDLYNRSIAKDVEWIVDKKEGKKGFITVTARPLSTAFFAPKIMFNQAKQYVLQSATIVNPQRYCQELGIELGTGQAHWIRKDSPFDVKNRLVYEMNTAPMGYKVIDDNLEKIAKEVEMILSKRPNEKGLIHTGSYKIQKFLRDRFFGDRRLVFPAPGEREAAIDEHIESKEPTVLVSPSITEGFDGKYDICRFQIICKIPYPSLGDRRTKILATRDWSWYDYQTLKTLVQAVGRGCRAEDDFCSTYVLDSGFKYFIGKANPTKDFKSCIKPRSEGLKALDK